MKFQAKPILRTCQKSALQHSLFWRYANFSKIVRIIHISMISTFYIFNRLRGSCAVRHAWCHSRSQNSSLLYMTTDKRSSGKPCSKVFSDRFYKKHFKCLLLIHSCLCESGYTCHPTLVIQLTSTLPFLEEGESTCKRAL